MNLEYLIQLLENKLTSLNNARSQVFGIGDIDSVNRIDGEILEVETTLSKLRFLLSLSITAESSNISLVEAAAEKTNEIENSLSNVENPTGCLSEYDLSTYASDPIYKNKISDLLMYMGEMKTASEIDTYISNKSIASPLTGKMIINVTQQYSVDVRLMMAIMELESRFGTAGVGVTTLNPGNVGNTGTDTMTYSSWEEGVLAVAKWLNRHRIGSNVDQETITDTIVNTDDLTVDNTTASSTESNISTTTPEIISDIETQDISTSTADTTATTTDGVTEETSNE